MNATDIGKVLGYTVFVVWFVWVVFRLIGVC